MQGRSDTAYAHKRVVSKDICEIGANGVLSRLSMHESRRPPGQVKGVLHPHLSQQHVIWRAGADSLPIEGFWGHCRACGARGGGKVAIAAH